VAFTTSPPTGQLKNGLVFCRINSWYTGNRLVSLPFSDHCEPLCDSTKELNFLIRSLQNAFAHHKWRYLEVRPISGNFGHLGDGVDFRPGLKYFIHTLDLRPNLDEVFAHLDKDSVQRRIRHAERAGLVEKYGRSDKLLRDFYNLFVITRQRHRLPPTPYLWFRNLVQCQGDALEIRIAYKEETPAAAILTLRFKDILYYKYGCSDIHFKKLGATPWLLWRAVSVAKSSGACEFDMGRSEEHNLGLLAFKRHWVPVPKQLVYWTFPDVSGGSFISGWKLKLAKHVFTRLPRRLLEFTGKWFYRHIG
jgi:hypothetical protein